MSTTVVVTLCIMFGIRAVALGIALTNDGEPTGRNYSFGATLWRVIVLTVFTLILLNC